LALAKAAIEALELDEVLFVPTNRNPLKRKLKTAPAKHRLAMVQALIKDEPKMAVCDIEILRGGTSYAVDTITELSFAQPADYWFIVGADAVAHISEWKQPSRLLRLCRLAVALRPGTTESNLMIRIPAEFREGIDMIPMKPVELSATELRNRLAAGLSPGPNLPQGVRAYIQQNKLYTV
jgi:nicotinate-nucleotide adenylyltransferase